jgi:hypothetical protein
MMIRIHSPLYRTRLLEMLDTHKTSTHSRTYEVDDYLPYG